jgi:hypothetical protein
VAVFTLAPLVQHKEVTCARLVQGEEPIPIADLVKLFATKQCRSFAEKPKVFFFLDVPEEPNPRCSTSTSQNYVRYFK